MCQVVTCPVCCSLDCQRPLGQDVDPPDGVVRWQRWVANLTLAVSRLHSRPVLARDRFWGHDVTLMEGHLANAQSYLRVCEDVRDHGSSHWALDRLQQIEHQWKALYQNRQNDWFTGKLYLTLTPQPLVIHLNDLVTSSTSHGSPSSSRGKYLTHPVTAALMSHPGKYTRVT